jgi:hypothetical protein
MNQKLTMENTAINPGSLEHAWTAEVELDNGQTITIWWTAWHSTKHTVSKVLWVASDLPRRAINQHSLILEGTAACTMRDELKKARYEKKITLKEITDKLSKMELPTWLQGQILQMTNHRKHERITCPVEQAMEAAVSSHILNELIAEEKSGH